MALFVAGLENQRGNRNPPVVAVSHVDAALSVDGHTVGHPELPRAGTLRAPVLDEAPIRIELHDPVVVVAVSDEKRPIGHEGDIGRAVEMTPEEWRRVLSTNLDSVFFWAQEAARRILAANKQGVIVNIASVLGLAVSKGAVAYATAKAGVVQVTKALAVELAFKGVRVNAIAPGWFITEMNDEYLTGEAGAAIKREIPMGRFGDPGDLDGALLLLTSDAGSYITGATIVVDGGQVIQIKG